MEINLHICVAVCLILILFYIVRMIRKRNLEIRYALSWIFVIGALIVFDIFPPILSFLSKLFGIIVPSNFLFILGFCFFVLLVLTLTIELSKQSNINKTLVQEIALLKKKVEEKEKNNE